MKINIQKNTNNIFSSIVAFLLGLIIFLKPDTTIKSISIIIGIFLIIVGSGPIIDLFRSEERKISFSVAPSIILYVIAFILFFTPELLVSIIPFIIGIVLIMVSAYKIQNIYNFKKMYNIFNIWNLVITSLILLLGFLLIVNPFSGVLAITQVIGIFLIVYAVLDIVDKLIFKNKVKIKVKD